MLAPQIGCSTFGSWDFIRVPAPAARMTTAAGRLTVTWRCSSIGCCVAGPPLAPVSVRTGHEARTRPFTCPTLEGYRPATRCVAARPQHDRRHITVRNDGGGLRRARPAIN